MHACSLHASSLVECARLNYSATVDGYPLASHLLNRIVGEDEPLLCVFVANHLATHVPQLLCVLKHHRPGLPVDLIEQAGAEDLLVGHRSPEDAYGIAQ